MKSININLDEKLTEDFEAVCYELGANAAVVFTMFAKKVAREKRIPFDVSIDPFYSESNMAHLLRGKEQLDAGKGIIRELIEVHDD